MSIGITVWIRLWKECYVKRYKYHSFAWNCGNAISEYHFWPVDSEKIDLFIIFTQIDKEQ